MANSLVVTLVSMLVITCSSLNIVDTASANADFSVLVEALSAANLVTTLNGAGPFTVFAPTNAAFDAALSALAINKTTLLARTDLPDILKYHVLSGKVVAADLNASQAPVTVQGSMVLVKKSDARVTFGSANVTTADLACDNGVIHVIDAVVLPPSMSIVETAKATADISILVEALEVAGLVATLSGTGPFTVFAPSNAAFAAALTALNLTKGQLLARSDLADILKYHVLNGKTMSTDLQASQSPATLEGKAVDIKKNTDGVTFGGAKVTMPDIACSNGVVHLIDAVVLPPTGTTTGGVAVSSLAAADSVAAVALGVAVMAFA